jgi:hypothetical protein
MSGIKVIVKQVQPIKGYEQLETEEDFVKSMHKSAIIRMTMRAKKSAPRLPDYPRCSP